MSIASEKSRRNSAAKFCAELPNNDSSSFFEKVKRELKGITLLKLFSTPFMRKFYLIVVFINRKVVSSTVY